jgi:hypothetical protein
MAATLQSYQDAYRDDGLQIIVVLFADTTGVPPDTSALLEFAEAAGIWDIPVLGDSSTTTVESVSILFEHDLFIPSLTFLSTNMTALSVDDSLSVGDLIDVHL